jgi:hypothetical protein
MTQYAQRLERHVSVEADDLGNELAAPFAGDTSNKITYHLGLTKREYFAGQVLSALISESASPNIIVKRTVKAVDLLLEELAKGR